LAGADAAPPTIQGGGELDSAKAANKISGMTPNLDRAKIKPERNQIQKMRFKRRNYWAESLSLRCNAGIVLIALRQIPR
jgi:hypothetical protein